MNIKILWFDMKVLYPCGKIKAKIKLKLSAFKKSLRKVEMKLFFIKVRLFFRRIRNDSNNLPK